MEAAKATIKALSEQSVAADPGLLPGKALLRRTAVKYPHGAVRLARGLIRLSRTPPRAFSIHLNNGQAGNPLNRCALSRPVTRYPFISPRSELVRDHLASPVSPSIPPLTPTRSLRANWRGSSYSSSSGPSVHPVSLLVCVGV